MVATPAAFLLVTVSVQTWSAMTVPSSDRSISWNGRAAVGLLAVPK